MGSGRNMTSDLQECGLATSRSELDASGQLAEKRFGGTTLYAPSIDELESRIQQITSSIETLCANHASLGRNNLAFLVRNHTALSIPRRVFGCLLGAVMRVGSIDQVCCVSVNHRPFRILVHRSRTHEFQQHLGIARQLLQRSVVLYVGELRERLFPVKGWGTWSSASYLLARLALLGTAAYIDSKNFTWPKGLEYAVGAAH